jgi:6-phosphogluconolactonase
VALAGGSTPRLLYETLAARGAAIDWSRTHVFWGDERCVPLDHPESNSKMAQDALLSKVEIPALNVHRMRGELVPHEGAREYDALLRNFFGGYQSRKTFDLILLGMGEDGHTASLFPEAGVLEEASRWSAAVQAPAGVSPRDRITLTLPPIVASARCVFLVTGERKRSIVTAIRKDPASAASIYPAARVAFFRESTWLIDEKAAGTARG